jgi:hypothetical protein
MIKPCNPKVSESADVDDEDWLLVFLLNPYLQVAMT